MPGYLILGMTYAFAAAVQPGPLQTYLISQTLANGWRRTIPAAFAPLLSDGPIIILVLLVLSNMPGWLVQVLQCAGGVSSCTWPSVHTKPGGTSTSRKRFKSNPTDKPSLKPPW